MNKIPDKSLILMVGVAGSSKSTLAQNAFNNNALIVSSDECRKEICGNEEDQSVTKEAFELFYKKIEEGIIKGKQVVADATNLDKFARERLYSIANNYNIPVYALIFNIPLDIIKSQNKMRKRIVPEYAIYQMYEKMAKTYYQICEEIPLENIIDIISSNDIELNNISKSFK